jgi:hypothetical protein
VESYEVAKRRAVAHDVIRVSAEHFKTPHRGILSTAVTADGEPATELTAKTLVEYCYARIELGTAERLGLVCKDPQGNYVEVTPRKRRKGAD